MKNNKNNIVVMLSYARSGGTLLNRCIASMPNVVMFSEVNIEALCPSSCSSIKEQAKFWYGISLKSSNFLDNIEELYNYCLKNNKILVIRDWSFGSFVPSRYNNFKPSKELKTLNMISERFPVVPFAFVRNSIDVWLSFKASPRTFYDKNLDFLYEFSEELIKNNINFFLYEDFCKNPKKILKKICDYTGIIFDNSFEGFSNYFKVTGDTDLPEHSRGFKKGKISSLSRRDDYNLFADFIENKTRAKDINKIFGY